MDPLSISLAALNLVRILIIFRILFHFLLHLLLPFLRFLPLFFVFMERNQKAAWGICVFLMWLNRYLCECKPLGCALLFMTRLENENRRSQSNSHEYTQIISYFYHNWFSRKKFFLQFANWLHLQRTIKALNL